MSNEPAASEDRPGSREETAERIGRSLGRFARRARKAAKAQQPEAERLAKQAVDAARPAAAQAGQFVRDHEAEIRKLGGSAARAAAYRAAPLPLRPVVAAVTDELLRKPDGAEDETAVDPAEDSGSPEDLQ